MHDVRSEDVRAQGFAERREQRGRGADPLGEERTIEINALAREDLRLPVKRQVIAFPTSTCASSPAPAMPRSIGRGGACACTMVSQPAQARFARTVRITLKRTGSSSRVSETSSP